LAVTLKRKSAAKERIKGMIDNARSVIFSSDIFPMILSLTVICILFVLYRMKSVEVDYKFIDAKKSVEKQQMINKELKAKKAKLLSSKNLKIMAKENKLASPKQEQIIVIP